MLLSKCIENLRKVTLIWSLIIECSLRPFHVVIVVSMGILPFKSWLFSLLSSYYITSRARLPNRQHLVANVWMKCFCPRSQVLNDQQQKLECFASCPIWYAILFLSRMQTILVSKSCNNLIITQF